jgi:hypothetical protein
MKIKIRIIALMIFACSFLALEIAPADACSCQSIPPTPGEKIVPEAEPVFVFVYDSSNNCCGSHTISITQPMIILTLISIIALLIVANQKNSSK